MKKIPGFVMGIINPLITWASTLAFNIQNISESLDMVNEATEAKVNPLKRFSSAIKDHFKRIRENENWLQMLNPFRLLLKLTVTPLRILLFLGHLISIAMTSDRTPGVPQILSVLVAMISEGFEDAHYFIGPDKSGEVIEPNDHKAMLKAHLGEEAEENGTDIPTRVLKFLASPFYALAALWDHVTSKTNQTTSRKVLTFAQAWNKQRGMEDKVKVLPETQPLSTEWKKAHIIFLIEKQERHLDNTYLGSASAKNKKAALTQLKEKVRSAKSEDELKSILLSEGKENRSMYNKHRLFNTKDSTSTQQFIEELPNRTHIA